MAHNENDPKENEQELSTEDLDAVAGGDTGPEDQNCVRQHYRNIYKGNFPNCAATVGDGSHCGTNDACYNDAIVYTGMENCSISDCRKAWK